MRRSSLAEQDEQARDLDDAAAAAHDLAEQLRHAPVPVVELALELGEDPQQLAHRLNGDTYADDLGRRVVTRQLARNLIGQRNTVEEQRQQIRKRSEAQAREQGERLDRERRAMLAAVDRNHAKYGGDDVDPDHIGALAVMTAADREQRLDDHQSLLDEMRQRDRTAQRFDANGQRIN